VTQPQTRRIGPLLATVLVAGNMIGSGIYLLPASMGAIGGVSVFGWIACAAGALCIAGVFAALAVIRPGTDGIVTYSGEGVHPVFGFMSWASYWVSGWVGNVAVALAAVGYLAVFFAGLKSPPVGMAATIAILWLMAGACIIGPRLTARLSGMTLLIGLTPIAVATTLGFLHFDPALFQASWNVTGKPDGPVILSSLTPIMWAYLGLESASVAAAVVDNPRRNLPIAALGGVTLASIVYIAANVAALGVMPAGDLARSTAPFADMVSRLAGQGAGAVVAVCAMLKACGTLAGFTLVTAESGRAGAASGFLPRAFSEVDPGRRPVRDVLLIAILMTLATLASLSPTLGAQFNTLTNVAVILFLAVYAFCAVALLRFSGAVASPWQRWGLRTVAILALGFCLLTMLTSDKTITLPAFLVLGITVVIWLILRFTVRRPAAA
jgi:arginine:agmatine antiporter